MATGFECFVCHRFLRRADHSCRGVLPSIYVSLRSGAIEARRENFSTVMCVISGFRSDEICALLEDVTNRLSRNVGTVLPLDAA